MSSHIDEPTVVAADPEMEHRQHRLLSKTDRSHRSLHGIIDDFSLDRPPQQDASDAISGPRERHTGTLSESRSVNVDRLMRLQVEKATLHRLGAVNGRSSVGHDGVRQVSHQLVGPSPWEVRVHGSEPVLVAGNMPVHVALGSLDAAIGNRQLTLRESYGIDRREVRTRL